MTDETQAVLDRAAELSATFASTAGTAIDPDGLRGNAAYILTALVATVDALREDARRMREAIAWALGYTDFRPRADGEGAYWWRKELSDRSGFDAARPLTETTDD